MTKENLFPISLGIFFSILLAGVLFFNPPVISPVIDSLENWAHDWSVRNDYKPLGKNPPIAIVNIDDESLQEIGRWPWSRDILAKLVSNLYQMGATVIGFDVVFSEPEANIVEKVIQSIPPTEENAVPALEKIKNDFNYDEVFAKSLQLGDSVLATVFLPGKEPKPVGLLPKPLVTLEPDMAENLDVLEMSSYLSNISLLENAAKTGGFINSTPDRDGMLRFAPLLIRYGNAIYPSLALQTAALYLLTKKTTLITKLYEGKLVLEGVKLDQYFLPTDPKGRILIPFRGPSFTFPYISAKDVLNGNVDKNLVETKMVFIGSSATALGDLKTTPLDPLFPGTEVHATIAAGMIDKYLLYKPAWGHGVTILLTLAVGFICSILFPFMGPFLSLIPMAALLSLLIFLKEWFIDHEWVVLSVFFPICSVLFLYIFNIAYGYLAEGKKRKEIKSTFGQYVPPEYIDMLMKKGKEISMEGESKELTVLFADIVGFTSISEPLSAPQLKKLLNLYLSPMTQIIFNYHGTIDKYVGDMIMAFWGAPVTMPNHAGLAVSAALEMQNVLENELNPELLKMNQPQIHVRIGLNTGVMNVGDMGSNFRKAYTVLGDAVNLASRLEGLGKYYHLRLQVGENTWEKTKNEFVYRKIDRVQVKGKHVGIDIYEPICPIGKATPEILEQMRKHHEALEAYQKQQWDQSEKLFGELQTSSVKQSDFYGVFLDRIKQYRLHPPPPSWDGTHILEDK